MVLVTDEEPVDDLAAVRVHLVRTDTLAATTLTRELVDLGALAVTSLGDRQQTERSRLDQLTVGEAVDGREGGQGRDAVRTDHTVTGTQSHAPDTGRISSHGTHVLLGEPDALAGLGHHHDLVGTRRRHDAHQLVAVAQTDRDEPGLAPVVVGVEHRLLHDAVAGHEEQEPVRLVVTGVDDRLDLLVRFQTQQVDDRQALCGAVPHRDPVRLEPVHLAAVREEQQERMRRGRDQIGDVVLVLEACAGHPAATADLGPERVCGDGLDVAAGRHHDDDLLVVDQILDLEVTVVVFDRGLPGRREFVADRRHLVADHLTQHDVVRKDRLEERDRLPQLLHLLFEALAPQAGQGGQSHVDDLGRLDLGEPETLALQGEDGRWTVRRRADGCDDLVDQVERLEEALDDVGPTVRLVESELRPTGDDLDLVIDVVDQRLAQVERAGDAVHQRHEVRRERRLQRRVLVEVVEQDQRGRVALELDDQAGHTAGALVADLSHTFDDACVRELGDLLLDGLHRGLVRDLGDDDAVALGSFFDLGPGSHLDRAAPGPDGGEDAGTTHDLRARREVRTLDEGHQVVRCRVGVVEQVQRGVDHLAQVVWRDVRRHADRDALAAVHQQVREPTGKDLGLLGRAVEVGREVDGVLVDARQHVHRQVGQTALGVAVGGRRVRR